MKPLDLTKPIQTRDGRPAKFLLKLKAKRVQPDSVVVLIEDHHGNECIQFYTESGSIGSFSVSGEFPTDLINVPVKHVREYWVNLYVGELSADCWLKKENADRTQREDRLACKKITIEFFEGEGL